MTASSSAVSSRSAIPASGRCSAGRSVSKRATRSMKQRLPAMRRRFKSAQLAVLAAAAVDARVDDGLVAFRLAGNAGAHAGQRLAPLLRDRLAAIVAFLGALP